MTLVVEVVPYGREASVALRDRIATAQADDPLAAVTVIVSGGYVGLSMRRLLASGDLGPAPEHGRSGIANVSFTTLPRFAEQLGATALASDGRRPLSDALLGAAVRSVLTDNPGVFASARNHPSTEASISRLWKELRGTDPATLQRLAAANQRSADLVRLLAAVTERLADRYDEHDLFSAASAALGATGATMLPRAAVIHLPDPLPAHERAFVSALGEHTDTTVLLGATGAPDADSAAVELADQLGTAVTIPTTITAARPTGVVSAPSADIEVHDALRTVMARHRAGTPLDRIAIAYGPAEPYARLVHEQLELNEIPFNGPGVRALTHTTAARTILGALALIDNDWRRNDVIDWLSSAPVRSGGRRVRTVAWDRLTRAAGVTHGLASWSDRLDRHRAMLQDRLTDARTDDEVSEARVAHFEREVADTDHVTEFVTSLAADIARPRGTWADWAKWAGAFLTRTLGGPASRTNWPPDEEQAVDEVIHALDRLSALDEVEAGPDRATFRRALESELDTTAPQTSRFGAGLLVGPVRSLAGLDLDVVLVLGMADGLFPTRVADDNLLPDHERAAAGDDLPLRAARTAEMHRTYLAALAAGSERILSHPRGDLRSGGEQRPSRWWLDGLAAVVGSERTLYSRDVDDIATNDRYRAIPSHPAAVRSAGEAAGPADHDLRLLLVDHDRGNSPADHWLVESDPVLAAGLALREARRSREYTRFDGDTAIATADAAGTRSFSPTALEVYATCPRKYLLSRVLHIEAPDKPERVIEISPPDRGNLVHKVLERFIEVQTDKDPTDRIQPGERWTEADHNLLDRLFDDVSTEYADTGRTGLRLLWEADRRAIRRDLHSLLESDDHHRADHRATPDEVELPFGRDSGTPVAVTLSDGRSVAFHGYVDRVDRTDDGAAVVRDYKSAKPEPFREIRKDPVDRGRHLQPAIYGLAARSHLADPDAPVDTGYWFTRESARFQTISIALDGPALDRFREAVAILFDGASEGHFPARPGEDGRASNCTWCDYDSLCPSTRYAEWDRIATAEPLRSYVDLAEGEAYVRPAEDQSDRDEGDAGE